MNYNKTNITFTLTFYVIFQKLNMNEMDIDVNDLNEIDRKLNVEVVREGSKKKYRIFPIL